MAEDLTIRSNLKYSFEQFSHPMLIGVCIHNILISIINNFHPIISIFKTLNDFFNVREASLYTNKILIGLQDAVVFSLEK